MKNYDNKPYRRTPLSAKLEKAHLATQTDMINWLKMLIDLTYQDGKNTKEKIRIELKKKLDEVIG